LSRCGRWQYERSAARAGREMRVDGHAMHHPPGKQKSICHRGSSATRLVRCNAGIGEICTESEILHGDEPQRAALAVTGGRLTGWVRPGMGEQGGGRGERGFAGPLANFLWLQLCHPFSTFTPFSYPFKRPLKKVHPVDTYACTSSSTHAQPLYPPKCPLKMSTRVPSVSVRLRSFNTRTVPVKGEHLD